MFPHCTHLAFALILAMSTTGLQAEGKPEPFPLDARSADEFRDQADELRAELQPGGRYASVDADGKSRIETHLATLQRLHDQREAGGRADTLARSTELVNASEGINGILAGDSGERLVCQMVKPVGSNRTQKVCQAVNDREKRNRESQLAHRDMIKWMPIVDTTGE